MLDKIKQLIKQAKGKTPEERRADLEKQREQNGLKKKKVDDELGPLTNRIKATKQKYERASGAEKRILQPELKRMIRHFKTLERERSIYLENESALTEAIGRVREIDAYKTSGVTEDTFDDLAIDLDEAAGDADGVADAMRDLDRAGRRRSRVDEGDEEGFDDDLALFDDPDFDASSVDEPETSSPEPSPARERTESSGAEDRPIKERESE